MNNIEVDNMVEKDLRLKRQVNKLFEGLDFECKAGPFDENRKLIGTNGAVLMESDGIYYDSRTQTAIYLEATTQKDKLTDYLKEKYYTISSHYEDMEKKLGLSGLVKNRILLLVFDRKPGGDYSNLDQSKVKIKILETLELEKYYLYLLSVIGKYLRYEFDNFLGISEEEKPRVVYAIRVNMSGQTVYVFELTVEEILKTCYVFRKKEVLDEWYQRILNKNKLKKITDFLKLGKTALFPNSILINLNNNISNINELDKENPDIVKFEYPMKSGSYRIIDGQHRVYGYCKSDKDLSQNKLIVVGFQDVPKKEDEIRFFLKINRTQSKINPALLSLLMTKVDFDKQEDEFWISQNAKLVLELNKRGHYKNKIFIGEAITKGRHTATISYMADKIQKTKLLAHKKTKDDKNIMDGWLQAEEEVENLGIVVDRINNLIDNILEGATGENEKTKIEDFITTNRGFELICRLIKGYYSLSHEYRSKLSLQEFFKNIRLNSALIEEFRGSYGSAGMTQIAYKVEKHIRGQGYPIKLINDKTRKEMEAKEAGEN